MIENIKKRPNILLIFVRYSFIIDPNYHRRVAFVGEIIAVLSGKGGTGKTSITAGVATALASEGKRCLCIDCDVGLRNLDIPLGLADCVSVSFLDVCQGECTLEQLTAHPQFETLFFLTAPLNRSADEIDLDAFCEMLMQARAKFDYVFLDAPAGVDAGFRLASAKADRALLVTLSDPGAVRDAGRTGQVLEIMGKENVRLIVNRVNPRLVSNMDLTVDDVMDNAGLPLLGIVPEDPNVILAASFGKPVLTFAKRCEAVKAYRRIAKRIQGFQEPINLK